MPGHQRRDELRENIRKKDRENVNFFCRYVLAVKNKKIPYN